MDHAYTANKHKDYEWSEHCSVFSAQSVTSEKEYELIAQNDVDWNDMMMMVMIYVIVIAKKLPVVKFFFWFCDSGGMML